MIPKMPRETTAKIPVQSAKKPVIKATHPLEPAYPRRILLCVTGLTPQIVTESMYALAKRDNAFHPTELHIITTAEGENRARLELLDPRRGQLAKLCKQHKLALPLCGASTIHVIKQAGQAVTDLRGADENAAAADCILDVVRELTADAQSQVHFPIAGGRKTMGFYLGYCASLLGRAQDDMSHILVNTPFENLPEFFFPPQPPAIIVDRNNKPHDTRNAEVDMAPVAFWRLRNELPSALLDTGRSFSETVRLLNALQGRPSLTLRIKANPHKGKLASYQAVAAGGYEVKLTPKSFAVLWMFAKLAKSSVTADRSVQDDTWHPHYEHIALAVYSTLTGKGTTWDKNLLNMTKPVDNSKLRNEADKLNKQFRDALGPSAAEMYRITVSKLERGARYSLVMPSTAITLEDECRLADQT